jgi:6-hydroxytryprostatin B O-methyltransferase
LSAIKWLLHFKIFDLVLEEAMAYDELAESANVPIVELKRMIRLAITSHIFSEPDEGFVKHTPFSRAFAHDENLRRGIPFFCDAVMPAAAKMTDATNRWPDSEESDETARNIALDDDMTFAQYLTEHNQADGYASLMRLLGSEPDQQAVCLADIVHGYTWSDLEEDSLVVDVRNCS